MKYSPATLRVMLSQAVFLGFLMIALAIEPRFLLSNDQGGASNYGTDPKTVVPYSIAFLGGSLLLWQASEKLEKEIKQYREIHLLLKILAGSIVFTAFTTYPYHLNDVLRDIHIYTTIGLFLVQCTIGVWLALFWARDIKNAGLFALMMSGFGVASVTFLGFTQMLFTGQLLFGFGFALVLMYSVNKNEVATKSGRAS